MCDGNSWQIATKFHRYSDNCGKILDLFPTNFRRYCDDGFKLKKKELHEIWYYRITF
jgi:hypothetical protein